MKNSCYSNQIDDNINDYNQTLVIIYGDTDQD